MKPEHHWSERAKAPDPDDLSSEQPPHLKRTESIFAGKRHTDYTQFEHHEDIPDPKDSGDPSRPQGEFWHRNERPGANAIEGAWPNAPHSEHTSDPPLKPTPESVVPPDERPPIFFGDGRKKRS